MTRRKLVALVGVFVLCALGLVVFSAGYFVTRTNAGRDRLRAFIVPLVKNAVKGGDVYVGHLGGSFIGGLTIDSLAIRDKRGGLFLSTGRVAVSYNWRDLIDYRILIRQAKIEHPYVHIVQHENGVWNFKEIFASGNHAPSKPEDINARSLGDYIVLDSATVRDGTFLLSMPWHPDDGLRAAQRDSVIRFHLATPSKMVAKTFDGYARTYAWRNATALISHVRLADPDSDLKFGQEFKIGTLAVDEIEPTFKFRDLHGDVRHLGDSVWFEVPHFDMPASTGHGTGKVWWGSDLPVRYDIAVRGDSVSLDDVNWVYPTLPRTGGGTLDLAIKNDPKNLQVVDFQLHKMDVHTTKSHVTGDMWFGTGAPLLLVRNVDLDADPVDFDLLRTINGKPFPEDWEGQLTGTVKARGGPLTHFFVDDVRGSFADTHVRGAESSFSGHGELDILYPALTAFHGFDVNVASVDLRSIEYLFPSFPRLGGFVSGTATLDSSWLDVRFSDAHVAHQDGPGDPSRVSGSGRITYGEPFMSYDVALNAEPLSLTMLARSYPALPPRLGLWTGPIHASGSSPDLALNLSLQSSNGTVSYDGRVDIDSVGGMSAQGNGQFAALNPAGLFGLSQPDGTISGHYDVDVAGESTVSLHGSANVALERTTIDSVAVYPSYAAVHFGDGRITVDSLRVNTNALTLLATGGIGLPNGTPDSLHFVASVDSLGGLRHFISHPDTTLLGAAATLPDSIIGSAVLRGDAIGTLDVLGLKGQLLGNNIYYNKDRGESLDAKFDLANALHAPTGVVDVRVDSVTLAGISFEGIGGHLRIDDSTHRYFAVDAESRNGPTASAGGQLSSASGAQIVDLDSLDLTIGDDRWRLANRPRLSVDSSGTRLDSLRLQNRDSAVIVASANIANVGPAFAQLRASGIPLHDLGILEQIPDTLFGTASLTATATGAKADPEIDAAAVVTAVTYNDVGFDRLSLNVHHSNAHVTASFEAVRDGQTAVVANGTFPIGLSLFGVQLRNDSLRATLRADTTDLSILKLFAKRGSLPVVTGRLAANVSAGGTMRAPVFDGTMAIFDGSVAVQPLGVTFNTINGRLFGGVNATGQDSINAQFAARTSRRDSVTLTGFVRNLAEEKGQTAFSFTVNADSLHALNKRSLADLYVSTPTPLVLAGTLNSPVLTGSISVDRGSIFIADPDLARKQSVEALADSAGGVPSTSSMLTTLMNNLHTQNVAVTLGQDVRLRSAQANVRLAGQLEVVTSATARTLASSAAVVPAGLTLAGQLTTTGGTYNLNLGLVQREFQVLADGTVLFDGGPPENPVVDIRAQYNVKQYRDRDLGVIVNLHGRMPNPTIEFSSNADYAISPSDLLSYLIVGAPGFDFTANGQTQQAIASVLSPTVSAYAADRLRASLGGWLDAFQFELGTSSAAEAQSGFFTQRNLGNYLSTSTVSAEKQVSNNLYLSVNTGFCELQNSHLALGAKIEYRFDPKLSLQAAYDPPTVNRCVEGQQAIVGFVPTPAQWSLSLLHSWRF